LWVKEKLNLKKKRKDEANQRFYLEDGLGKRIMSTLVKMALTEASFVPFE